MWVTGFIHGEPPMIGRFENAVCAEAKRGSAKGSIPISAHSRAGEQGEAGGANRAALVRGKRLHIIMWRLLRRVI
jgi:hypothetical protein